MLVSSGTLLATLLNFIFPDAIKLFIYVTTLSTVLFLVVWAMIIISYIVFVKRIQKNTIRINLNSLVDLRQRYVVLAFFAFVFVLLFFSEDTRAAIFISPIWFIFLFIFYRKYKSNAEDLAERTRSQGRNSINY